MLSNYDRAPNPPYRTAGFAGRGGRESLWKNGARMMNDSKMKPGEDKMVDESVFGGLNRLNRLLNDLDERGLVLSMAAFAEDALGILLRAFLLPTSTTPQLLEGFNAPLGTFSSRTKAAYSFGLITKDQFEDLERLRKVRNEFAHSWLPITLETPSIARHIKALNYSSMEDEYPETLREKLRSSVSALLVELRSAANQIEKKGLSVKLTGDRLLALYGGDLDQQLQAARAQLAVIRENLASASGEKYAFFKMLRRRLEGKVVLIFGDAPEGRQEEVLALLDDLKTLEPK